MSDLAYMSAKVHGYVQGVYFRAFVSRAAKALSLRGYACNLPGNIVEVCVEGDREKLEELVRQLEVGPPESVVEKVEVDWSDYTGQFANFEIRY